jgi:SAM-dependent methyltransferase
MSDQGAALEQCYLRADQSPAAARYRERTHGMALNQFNCTTMDQLALLLDVLKLKPGVDALDAGCGTGRITQYLASTTGSNFVGIDLLPGCVQRARQLAAEGPGRLEFKVADMEAPGFAPASFDTVISIESLYPTKDHIKTIATFKNILRPTGQMGLFHTYFSETPGLGLGPDDTLLAKALRANGLNYKAHDLSEADRRFWKRSHEIAEEMRSEFAAEGNSGLLIDGERDAVLGLINQNRHARYLYHAVIGR